MKILHIDETFHPSFGYHTNPLAKYQAKQGMDVSILTVDEDHLYPVFKEFEKKNQQSLKIEDENYIKHNNVDIIRVPVKRYISNRAIYERQIFEIIDEIAPDIIYVHLLESYISIRILLKINQKYPIIFDSHMLAVASKNPFKNLYEAFFKKIVSRIIKKNQFKVIRTQNDDYIINHLGIPKELAPYISFGTDTLHFKKSLENRIAIRKKYNISNEDFVFVYTGKITADKGLDLLAEAIQDKFEKKITFVIVGNSFGEFGEKVEQLFSTSENKLVRIPIQDYLSLPYIYQMADCAVYPKQNSMSFYDAQACGLPVLLEDNELNSKRVSKNNGFTYKKDSIESLREEISNIANIKENDYRVISDNCIRIIEDKYSYGLITKKYNDIIISEFYRQTEKKGR